MDYLHLQHLKKKKLQPKFDVLIPFLRFEKELENELLLYHQDILSKNEKFITIKPINEKPIWAQAHLKNCQMVTFSNKSQAIKILKSIKNLGVNFQTGINIKLADAVKKELRELKLKRIDYQVPSKFNFKYFAWGLINDNTLIICETPSEQYPLGWHEFNEDKTTPPNRAYLKVWEILTLNHIQLNPNDIIIDVGSSPGGWSWALSHYVKKVYSIDKASLDQKVLKQPNIIYKPYDAFQLNPSDYNDCTWLFSDIICTPERLLSLVENWHENSNVKNYVCTIKFKGECDFDIISQFKKIKNSKIIHLYQNKNEVTWIKQV